MRDDRDWAAAPLAPMSKVFTLNERRSLKLRSDLNGKLLQDMATVWLEEGITALRQYARDDPGGFCRTFAALLPKQARLEVMGDAPTVVLDFRGREETLANPIDVSAPATPPGAAEAFAWATDGAADAESAQVADATGAAVPAAGAEAPDPVPVVVREAIARGPEPALEPVVVREAIEPDPIAFAFRSGALAGLVLTAERDADAPPRGDDDDDDDDDDADAPPRGPFSTCDGHAAAPAPGSGDDAPDPLPPPPPPPSARPGPAQEATAGGTPPPRARVLDWRRPRTAHPPRA
jgi:hypothetical protein